MHSYVALVRCIQRGDSETGMDCFSQKDIEAAFLGGLFKPHTHTHTYIQDSQSSEQIQSYINFLHSLTQ